MVPSIFSSVEIRSTDHHRDRGARAPDCSRAADDAVCRAPAHSLRSSPPQRSDRRSRIIARRTNDRGGNAVSRRLGPANPAPAATRHGPRQLAAATGNPRPCLSRHSERRARADGCARFGHCGFAANAGQHEEGSDGDCRICARKALSPSDCGDVAISHGTRGSVARKSGQRLSSNHHPPDAI